VNTYEYSSSTRLELGNYMSREPRESLWLSTTAEGKKAMEIESGRQQWKVPIENMYMMFSDVCEFA